MSHAFLCHTDTASFLLRQVWADGKLRLNLSPTPAAVRGLLRGADLAAVTNLRRDTAAQEYEWIRSWMCPDGAAAPRGGGRGGGGGDGAESCARLRSQWAEYMAGAPRDRPSRAVHLQFAGRSLAERCLLFAIAVRVVQGGTKAAGGALNETMKPIRSVL